MLRTNEIPPNFLFYMFTAIVVGPGLWMLLLMWAFGDAKRIPFKRIGQVVLICLMLVGLSQAQAPAQAQQDSLVRRVERVEDSTTQLQGLARGQDEINRSNRELLATISVNSADREKRLQALEQGLTVIQATAESVQRSTKDATDRIQLLVALAGAVLLAYQVYRDRTLRNGHGPFSDIKEQMKKQQNTIDEILQTMPRSRRKN